MINKLIEEIKSLLFTKIDSELYCEICDHLDDIQTLSDKKDNIKTFPDYEFNFNSSLDGIPLIALEDAFNRIGTDKPTRENRK